MHHNYRHIILFLLSTVFSFNSVNGQEGEKKLRISHLTGDFYIYTTFNTYQGQLIPAHGMYVVAHESVVLFDTPWDTTQFQPLLDSIWTRHGKKVSMCLATHWHGDRTAGLEYYKMKGIRTYTTTLTNEWSRKNYMKTAEFLISNDTVFNSGPYSFEVYYPGPGHTTDNIVVWFGKNKILYGGCLIKGVSAKNLGNMSDANIDEYANSLKKVQKKYPDAEYIIVSHNDWKDNNSLKHSINLAEQLKIVPVK